MPTHVIFLEPAFPANQREFVRALHQVGGGVGKDLATAGGAVAGGLVGANVGRTNAGQAVAAPDVQRCTTQTSQSQPAYWDVTYTFRGQEHRVQMTAAPGPTITVNEQGEPRA